MLSPAAEAMLTQLAPVFKGFMDRIAPLLDQPVIRFPWSMPLAAATSVAAGATNFPLDPTSFSYNLEWPFEVRAVKFAQDPAHTYQDWRVAFQDQILSQPMQKNPPVVADLVDDNTGKWVWEYPWIVRPKGGAIQVYIDNLDTVNPITINMSFIGYLMIPR